MNKETYNGWTNYETWRINLEMFDGLDSDDFNVNNPNDLADILEDQANEILECSPELALDYARSFISCVDWKEIAESKIER